MSLTDGELAELKETFDHFDTDDNGVIDRNEFRSLLRTLDPKFSEADVRTGMKILDANENDVIDWDEFVAWWGSD